MDERQQLRQTTLRFSSELERALGGNFANMPRPLEQLLDAIDCEPLLSAHMAACQSLLPDGFDAVAEVDRVSADPSSTFGPLSAEGAVAAAQAYLIMQELVARKTKFHDPVFLGYESEAHNLRKRFAAFVDEVVMRLVGEVKAYLLERSEALGVSMDEGDPHASAPQQTEASSATASAGAPGTERLQDLLANLHETLADLCAEDREDALLQLEALQDELLCEHPKDRVVRVLLRALRAFDGSARFAAALEQLAEAVLH